MTIRNIFQGESIHLDPRGLIADVFYKNPVDHVAFISTQAQAIRGNHYHKNTTQHTLILEGVLEYWYKPIFTESDAQCVLMQKGDLITSLPNEIHAMRALQDTQIMVFTEGVRGGADYEADTFRVDNIIL